MKTQDNWKIMPDQTRRDKKIIQLYKKGFSIADLSRMFQLYHSQISIIVNPEMRKKHNERVTKYKIKWLKTIPNYLIKCREASNVCNTRRYNVCPSFRRKNLEYSRKWQKMNR